MKSCKYIKVAPNKIYVPRPTSFFGGMARHKWLQKHFGEEADICIASPRFWEDLCNKHEVLEVTDESR